MVQGRNISKKVDHLITEKALENPNRSRELVAQEIINICNAIGEAPPAEATLLKKISNVRAHAISSFDEPWSLGSLTRTDLLAEKRELPSEVIPLLLTIKAERRRGRSGPARLTIREAFWVSKLCSVITSPRIALRFWPNTITSLLYDWSVIYAIEQRISEISNIPLDTSRLDMMITHYPEQYAAFPLFFLGVETPEEIHEHAQQVKKYFSAANYLYEVMNIWYLEPKESSEEERKQHMEAHKIVSDFNKMHPDIPSEDQFLSDDRIRMMTKYSNPRAYYKMMNEKRPITPNPAQAHIAQGYMYRDQGKIEDAVLEVKEALRINPNDAHSHYSLGEMYRDQGKLEDAERECEEGRRIVRSWKDHIPTLIEWPNSA